MLSQYRAQKPAKEGVGITYDPLAWERAGSPKIDVRGLKVSEVDEFEHLEEATGTIEINGEDIEGSFFADDFLDEYGFSLSRKFHSRITILEPTP